MNRYLLLYAGLLICTIILICSIIIVHAVKATPAVGLVLPAVTLSSMQGGRLDADAWSSTELVGKLHLLFYYDPDHHSLNKPAYEALKAETFPDTSIAWVTIINMAASWLPSAAVEHSLRRKQHASSNTIYLKDTQKTLVKTWGFADHASVVALTDIDGTLLFYRAGKLTEDGVEQLRALIRDRLSKQAGQTI